MRPRVLATALLACVLAAVGLPAHADVSWSVAAADDGTGRANYAFQAEPGAIVEDTWVLTNQGTEPVSLRVFATDAITTASGQLDLLPSDQEPTGVGSWIETAIDEVTLEAGQTRDVDFELKVPEGTLPGDYAGGLVTVLAADKGATVAVERRLGTRVHVHVPGDVVTNMNIANLSVSAPLAWNPLAGVDVAVSYQVTNDGTGRAFAPETVAAVGPTGHRLGRTTGELPEIMPGSFVERETKVAGVWALGPTTVSVTIVPTGIDGTLAEPVTTETTLWLIPWGWIAVVGVLVIAGIVVAVVRRRSRYEWVDAGEAAQD